MQYGGPEEKSSASSQLWKVLENGIRKTFADDISQISLIIWKDCVIDIDVTRKMTSQSGSELWTRDNGGRNEKPSIKIEKHKSWKYAKKF